MKKPTSMGEPRLSPAASVDAVPSTFFARIPFHGTEILAAAGPVERPGDRPVPLRPFCERLGVALSPQLAKLRGKPWATVTMIVTVGTDGRIREMACLPLRALPMWLATINPGKVASGVRPMLKAYQQEATEVLYQYFLAPTAQKGGPAEAQGPEGYAMGREVAALKVEVRALAAEVHHLQRVIEFTTEERAPEPPPRDAKEKQTLALLRAWMQEETSPLPAGESREYVLKRGLTAATAAASYHPWAEARGQEPLTTSAMARWLSDPELRLVRYWYPDVRNLRYGLQLRTPRTPYSVS